MDGVVFFRTERLAEVVAFHRDRVGAEVRLEQPDRTILRAGGFRVGFCDRADADTDGVVTFVVDTRAALDDLYAELSDVAEDEPQSNETYEIYRFFAADPEGRTVEVRTFKHDTDRGRGLR